MSVFVGEAVLLQSWVCRFRYQVDVGFVDWVWQCPFPSSLVESFKEHCCQISYKGLVGYSLGPTGFFFVRKLYHYFNLGDFYASL